MASREEKAKDVVKKVIGIFEANDLGFDPAFDLGFDLETDDFIAENEEQDDDEIHSYHR